MCWSCAFLLLWRRPFGAFADPLLMMMMTLSLCILMFSVLHSDRFFFVFQNTIFYLLLLFGLLAVIVNFRVEGWLAWFVSMLCLVVVISQKTKLSFKVKCRQKRNEITLFLGLFLWWTEKAKIFAFFRLATVPLYAWWIHFSRKWRVSFAGLQMFYFDFKIQLVGFFTRFFDSSFGCFVHHQFDLFTVYFWLVGLGRKHILREDKRELKSNLQPFWQWWWPICLEKMNENLFIPNWWFFFSFWRAKNLKNQKEKKDFALMSHVWW